MIDKFQILEVGFHNQFYNEGPTKTNNVLNNNSVK